MITNAINVSIINALGKGWDKIYWAVDIHGTMIVPNYVAGKISTEFYPRAKEVMQMLSTRKEIVLIMYTCSYPHEIEQYLELFENVGIHFDYVNCNPEVTDGGYGYYKEKFYFNVLLEDKAGFNPLTDWEAIEKLFDQLNASANAKLQNT